MFHRTFYTACLLTCLALPAYAHNTSASLGGGGSGAGPINTIQAGTMPKGGLSLDVSSEFTRFDRFSDSELAYLASQHVHGHSADWALVTSAGISYGLTDDLTLSLTIPYVHRSNIRSSSHVHGGGGVVNSAEDHGDAGGWGDMVLLGKYRFWEKDDFQAALLLGGKAPTGQTGVRNHAERLEAEHQPGSGSWDGLFGLAAGKSMGQVSLDANVLYGLVTEGAQNTDLGDRVQYNMAVSYRLGGKHHDHGNSRIHHHGAFDLALELNGEWTDKQKADGEIEEDSGGNVIFLSPGIRYAPDDTWAAQLSVGVPVVSNMGRGEADTDYKITAGISKTF